MHLDHTLLDIQVRHAHTGQVLGRPWATFAVDAYSRRLLAVVLTLDDQPSHRTCMLVLREMVSRLGRLPQTLVVDNGKEFHSTYFQALLAHYAVEVAYRPPAQPRFGDVVERLFRTAHTQFIYNLTGNTNICQVRLMTASHDPRHLALWTLEALNAALREWAYEVYDQTLHSSLGQSPREVYEDSLAQHGERAFQRLDYNAFILQALPAPARKPAHGSAQRSEIENIYYWHDLMYRPDILGTQVAVRYDPFNVGVAYAYLDHTWVRCTSEHYVTFHNRTEQELQIAREESRSPATAHEGATFARSMPDCWQIFWSARPLPSVDPGSSSATMPCSLSGRVGPSWPPCSLLKLRCSPLQMRRMVRLHPHPRLPTCCSRTTFSHERDTAHGYASVSARTAASICGST